MISIVGSILDSIDLTEAASTIDLGLTIENCIQIALDSLKVTLPLRVVA